MQKLRQIADLTARLPPRPTLVLHSACAEPQRLATELAQHAASFDGATLYHLMPMGAAPYAEAPASGHLSVTSFFPGKGLRAAITAGRARTLRHPLSAIPGLFDRGEIRSDAVLLQVTPPDAQGRVSLGLSVDYMHAVLRQKPLVIAQINPQLPRTAGNASFDVSLIDWYIDGDEMPQTVAAVSGDDVDRRIAAHVASLIDDGAVLQVGIGSLPDLVLGCMHDRRHLGVHSGIVTDALRPLIESGVIDNSRKTRFGGVSVTTMAAGTPSFYEFLDGNPAIEFHPCSLTHSAEVLAAIDGLTAVNSALQVDLSGRVNAEAVAGRVIAAPGGLPDFARGAHQASNGRSIIALRAGFKGGSNIVARLAPDAPVSLDADIVDYIVTEFGVAALRGLSLTQRVEALIAIADPAHHDALTRQWAAAA